MKKHCQGGFGTAKLLAWVGGIVAVAVTVYVFKFPGNLGNQGNSVQSNLAEVFVSTDVCRAQITQTVQKTTATALSSSLFGCDGGAASGVKISRYLKSIAVGNAGAITVTLDFRSLPELTPTTSALTLVPLVDANTPLGTGDVHKTITGWRCGSPQDGTTVEGKYLPANCRG